MASTTRGADEKKNIFCLETYSWEKGLDRTTVHPILELLRKMGRCDYLHRDVATKVELGYFLEEYLGKKFKTYPILYLCFHGSEKGIILGDETHIDLDFLTKWMAYRCSNRVVCFGSCNTLNMHGHTLNAFVRKTQALAVCGYSKTVDWLQAAAFETLILGTLQDCSFTKDGMADFEQRLKDQAGGLFKNLGFEVIK